MCFLPPRRLQPVDLVAIHANDIMGRPCSVQPCKTYLEESGIGCGPVLIGASASAAFSAAAVSGTPENVRHLVPQARCVQPYVAVHIHTVISNCNYSDIKIQVWQLQPYKDKTK